MKNEFERARRCSKPSLWTVGPGALAAALVLWTAPAANAAGQEPPEEAKAICDANAGSLSSNSTRLTAELRLYQASFSKLTWSGELRAIKLKADGSPDLSSSGVQWQASEGIPKNHSERRIFTWGGATLGGIEFTWDGLEKAGLHLRLGTQDVVAYLRGDVTNTDYRARSQGVLGAIVNSELAFAGLQDFGYEALVDVSDLTAPESIAGAKYLHFLNNKNEKAATKSLILVGANDGMLHGFDASSGGEEFAYVPRALIEQVIAASEPPRSHLTELTDPKFTQRYFVDGSPWVGDAYWDGSWRTVVVGTAGAGGKGAFALTISNPDSAEEPYQTKTHTLTKANVLWDIWDGDGSQQPDLGYAFGQPVIGLLRDNDFGAKYEFYAIFGNGRQSKNQCAVLFLVRLRDGLVRKIDTKVCGGNGLGRPSLFDAEVAGQKGFRVTDFAYAGDLKGNLWKFNLSSTNPGEWDVAIKISGTNEPLFKAGESRPITGAIEIGPPPSGVDMPAAMLWFGTGRYFTPSDATTFNGGQAMYGILDKFPKSGGRIEAAQLLKRTVSNLGASGGTILFDAKKEDAVNYKSEAGWFIELDSSVSPRERFVGFPLIKNGMLMFATVRPGDSCAKDSSAIYAIDPYHGRKLVVRPFVNAKDADFMPSRVGIVRSLIGVDAGRYLYLYAGGTRADTGGSSIQFEKLLPAQRTGSSGRVSWREIVR